MVRKIHELPCGMKSSSGRILVFAAQWHEGILDIKKAKQT